MEIIAAAGVRGVYVTHLTGLYGKLKEINSKGYPTKISSIVSVADRESGKRLYKMKLMPPSQESLAFTIYKQFGATLEDLQKECE
jgi:hypothetical protein